MAVRQPHEAAGAAAASITDTLLYLTQVTNKEDGVQEVASVSQHVTLIGKDAGCSQIVFWATRPSGGQK